ncbi:hypothetical protein YWY31_06480 [Paenibacillus illinoisensis]
MNLERDLHIYRVKTLTGLHNSLFYRRGTKAQFMYREGERSETILYSFNGSGLFNSPSDSA